MKPLYWIMLAAIVVSLAGFVAWEYLGRRPGALNLASRALAASNQTERLKAVSHLRMLPDTDAAKIQLRRLANEAQDPEVVYSAAVGLSTINDRVDIPWFIKALDNPESKVRRLAFDHLRSQMSFSNIEYKVDDPSEARLEAVRQLEKVFEAPPVKAGGDPQ